jgi:hypothetical protein
VPALEEVIGVGDIARPHIPAGGLLFRRMPQTVDRPVPVGDVRWASARISRVD